MKRESKEKAISRFRTMDENDETSSRSADVQSRHPVVVPQNRRSRSRPTNQTKDLSHEFPTLVRHRESRTRHRRTSPETSSNTSVHSSSTSASLDAPYDKTNKADAKGYAEGDIPSLHSKARFPSHVAVGTGFRRAVSDGNASPRIGRGDAEHSTHSISSHTSVSERRRSIQAQSPQLPPAFRNLDFSASPRARKSSSAVDGENDSTRSLRGLPPSGSEESRIKASDNGVSSRPRRSKRPTMRASTEVSKPKDPKPAPSAPPPERKSNSPRSRKSTKGRLSKLLKSEVASGLSVTFIDFNLFDGDKAIVATYNKILESIALSDNPEAQRGLDVLATMEQNGVAPNDRTWELLNLCSKIDDEHADEEEHDDIFNSEGEMRTAAVKIDDVTSEGPEHRQMEKLSLYSHEGHDTTLFHENSTRKPWIMKQDLSLLPPAFRSSIVAMLRRKNQKGVSDGTTALVEHNSMVATSRNSLPQVHTRATKDRVPSPCNVMPSVADRKKIFLLSNDSKSVQVDSDISLQNATMESAPVRHESEDDDKKFSSLFAQHGVVKYMRPDGHGKAPLRKAKVDGKSSHYDEDDCFSDTLEDTDKSSDITTYTTMLASIANSDFHDKANQAGKVLRKMKNLGMLMDEKTRELLQACAQITEAPTRLKPHEMEFMEEPEADPPPFHATLTAPTQVVTMKRVRFAERDSFRFIQRRRSIGSNERWDDPLTPPKRIQDPVDLAPGRFSSGLRDDRPAPPRRSNSMSSLLSASSHSARSSDKSSSSSESADSIFDDEPLSDDRFKLPFADSPEIVERKKAVCTSKSRNANKIPQLPVVSATPSRTATRKTASSLGMPSVPIRSSSKDQDIFISPTQLPLNLLSSEDEPISPNPLVLTLPVDDSIVYRTPPSVRKPMRRRSISGTERRADFPLTPPRRVSAPLEIFIAQEALKAKKARETKEEIKMIGSSSVLPLGTPFAADDLEAASLHPNDPTSLRLDGENDNFSKEKRRSTSTKSITDDPVRLASLLANVNRAKAVDKKARTAGRSSKASSLVRHGEKMPEHWKLLKFRDEFRTKGFPEDTDDIVDAQSNSSSLHQDYETRSSCGKVSSHMNTSAREGSQRNRSERRANSRKSHPTISSVAPGASGDASWQRVIQASRAEQRRKKREVDSLAIAGRISPHANLKDDDCENDDSFT